MSYLKNRNAYELLFHFNNSVELKNRIRYYVEYNIGNIEASIGLFNDSFLNLFVKILDDFAKGTDKRINENIYIIFYLGYKFLTLKFEYSIQPAIEKIKNDIYTYLNIYKIEIFNYINNLNLIDIYGNKVDVSYFDKNGKIDDYFMNYFVNFLIRNLPSNLSKDLYEFIEDYESIIPNAALELKK